MHCGTSTRTLNVRSAAEDLPQVTRQGGTRRSPTIGDPPGAPAPGAPACPATRDDFIEEVAPVLKFFVLRVLSTLPVLVLVTFVVFGLVLLIPGDPAATIAGPDATVAEVAAVRERLGLDRPVLVQYWDWVTGALAGDLGTSLYTSRPVATSIGDGLPVTISLAATALLISLVIAVPTAIVSALRRGTWIDRVATVGSSLGIALPSFWLGLVFVLVFSLALGWLPATGYVPLDEDPAAWLRHILLPALTLGIASAAESTRQLRGSIIGVLQQDYVRTARAKGLRERMVIGKHVLKNASVPLVTVLGLQITALAPFLAAQRVPQPVAERHEREDGEGDEHAREDAEPRRAAVVEEALADHRAPAGVRGLHTEAQERQPGLRQHRVARGDRDRHGERGEGVGQDVPPDDQPRRGADAAGGLHEGLLPQPEHHAAHEPQEPGRHEDPDREHRVAQARAEHRDQRDRQQQRREAHRRVVQAHDEGVEAAAGVAGQEPERHPDRHRHDQREADREQRHPGADDQPAEDVAAELVGAEQVTGRERALQHPPQILVVRVRRRDVRPDQRDQHEEGQDAERDHRGPVAADPAPEVLPGAAAVRGGCRGGGGGFAARHRGRTFGLR
nr:ABC transporter permease subunit [Pseudonocardia sp. MH-G8]